MSQAHTSALKSLSLKALPFADAASADLPLAQLLRMSLFQVSVGMASVMLLGTLNRVMIVELSVPAMIVAIMIALPVLIAPLRASLGFKSDTYRSAIGWKRVPYLWFGSLWQMGGLAVMPFALIVLSGDQTIGPSWAGEVLAALAFLMTGFGIHMTQTAGLSLASDRASDETRPRVVALLYVMFLLGMGAASLIIGWLLRDFSNLLLIRVVQGAALTGLILNLIALWKQEPMRPMSKEARLAPRPKFKEAWQSFTAGGAAGRLLGVVFFGTLAFNMQDVLLEPYGGEVLGLSVSATTTLTAMWVLGALTGLYMSARQMRSAHNSLSVAVRGLLVGLIAFPIVIFAGPLQSVGLFFAGTGLIGLGAGLFAVATLHHAMQLPTEGTAGRGLVIGAWGAAQATAAGLAVAFGGTVRDWVNTHALAGDFGTALQSASTGYSVVYHIEILFIFITLVLIGPMIKHAPSSQPTDHNRTGLSLVDFPT
jgi:BCD family chlorophyll transporter-like MFS transporter